MSSDPRLLTGPRKPRWTWELLDSADEVIRALDGVTAGSITQSATERLGGSATLSITDRGEEIDWLSHRVRATYDPGTGFDPWTEGVFLLTSPQLTSRGGRRSWEVGLLSKMAIIDGDSFGTTYSLAAGSPIIPAVLAIIRSTGETRIAVTDNEATLREPFVGDAAESKLTIINGLLEAAGYWALWCDRTGQFRVEPYVRPQDRTPVWTFTTGDAATGGASIYKPSWTREQDLSGIPNQVVCSTAGSDDEPALVGVAENLDPTSPFSIPRRGRVISASYDIEADSQAVANQLAQRRLLDAMSPVAKLQVVHALVPLEPNDVVEFMPTGGVEGQERVRATVQSKRFPTDFSAQCTGEWREVTVLES